MDTPASPGPPSGHSAITAGMPLPDALAAHEANSEHRYECLKKEICEIPEKVVDELQEHNMGKAEEIHVHNVGGTGEHGGGLGLAALAAMSQKGVGNDMSPLALAAMMKHGHHDGYGFGGADAQASIFYLYLANN
jgi:hypothetical protein